VCLAQRVQAERPEGQARLAALEPRDLQGRPAVLVDQGHQVQRDHRALLEAQDPRVLRVPLGVQGCLEELVLLAQRVHLVQLVQPVLKGLPV